MLGSELRLRAKTPPRLLTEDLVNGASSPRSVLYHPVEVGPETITPDQERLSWRKLFVIQCRFLVEQTYGNHLQLISCIHLYTLFHCMFLWLRR